MTGAWPAAGDNGDVSPVMTAGTARPLPGCPARRGKGADTTTADFVLVADDCISGPDGQPTVTEVFGYFRLPGEEHDDDVLLTAGLRFRPLAGSRDGTRGERRPRPYPDSGNAAPQQCRPLPVRGQG